MARLDGPEREARLLVDYREALIAERTRVVCRLRWQLHELDPSWESAARSLNRTSTFDKVEARLDGVEGLVARLAWTCLARARELTIQIDELALEITALVEQLAPTLLAIVGCGPISAAKILGETAGIDRFHSADAYARHNGTAPLPVWSSNRTRHRLSRVGNRQINAALHRIALSQAHCHPDARALLARRKANGDGGLEALRILKRRLSDVVYRALRTDLNRTLESAA